MDELQHHAEVKRVFQEAVLLPEAELPAFLDRHCSDRQLRRDVEALLAHHDSDTIMADEHQQLAVDEALRHVLDRRVVDSAADDLTHLSPQYIAELLELLRRRLVGLSTVLLGILVVVVIRNTTSTALEFSWSEIIVLIPVSAAFWVLRSSLPLTLQQLRATEIVMMASLCVLMVIMDIAEIMKGSRNSDVAVIVGASMRTYLNWSVLILIYGVFVPNTWRRAALLLMPLACIPYLIRFAVSAADPQVDRVLDEMKYVRALPIPFLAAITAIYASHIFYRTRIATVRARQFAQYRLGRLLGRGGMGNVYEAEHSLLKRACAVKLIHPDREYNPASLARFEREVQATARLTHPNTIEVFDYGQTIKGVFYFVMELLPGLNLSQLVAQFGPLPASRACYLLCQVCGALQEAHQAGLIHRDIKPANLFATERGGVYDVAKVMDFGLVRELDVPIELAPELPHVILGTPLYMAPEQGLGSGDVDARTDIYSLGATAYYLVTGQLPFDKPTPQAQLTAHLSHPVRPPSELCEDVPADVEQFILRCLEKEPAQRYQSMDELQAAIESCACVQGWNAQLAKKWWAEHGGCD